MPLTVPNLTYRLSKSAPLTHQEGDANLATLRDFCNRLASVLDHSLKEDGTLKERAVSTDALSDLSVTRSKLGYAATYYYAVDTGPANALTVDLGSPYPTTPVTTPPSAAETGYRSGMVIFVRINQSCTGPATIRMNSGVDTFFGTKEIRKAGGGILSAGELQAGSVYCLIYDASMANGAGWFFLVAGSGSGSSAFGSTPSLVNFTGLDKVDPNAVALGSLSSGSPAQFSHGFGAVPHYVRLNLVCTSPQLGYLLADHVPLDNFFDASGQPAFDVQYTSDKVIVSLNTAAPRVMAVGGPSIGMAQPVALSSWEVKAQIWRLRNESSLIFPDVEVQVTNPDGAFGFGNDLFFHHQSGGDSTGSFLSKMSMLSGQVSMVAYFTPPHDYISHAIFKLKDGVTYAFWMSDEGFFKISLDGLAPGTVVPINNHAYWGQRLVWVDEKVLFNGQPTYYLADDCISQPGVENVRIFKMQYSGSSWNAPSQIITLNLRSVPPSTGNTFLDYNRDARSLMMFQYNPIKRRIYAISNGGSFLSIFELDAFFTVQNGSFGAWCVDAASMSKIAWKKTVAIAGGGGCWVDSNRERYCVEFDLTTGEEKSIAFTRINLRHYAGQVVRVPWRE